MRLLRAHFLAAGVVMLLAACSTDAPDPAPQGTSVGAAPQAPAPVQQVVQTQVPESATSEPSFVFDPTGLRDPFEPFVKLEPVKKVERKIIVPKTPLQRYAVEELRIVGVIWAEAANSKALIEDPEGKGYVVGVGTLVGDQEGKIIRIHPEKVLVEERFVDLLGEENLRVVTMSLHKPEGEVNP